MELKNLLTIIIPCKNEKETICKTLDLLNYQIGIRDVSVIISDSSDDVITKTLLEKRKDKFTLNIIQGGLPSIARNNGVKYVETPYVLFMDADIFLINPTILIETTNTILKKRFDLVTTKFRTDDCSYNYVFRTFDIIQKVSKYITPFCLGGFMLTRTETFKRIGGFDEQAKVAEDYLYSKNIKPNKFYVTKNCVYTPARRFKNKGVFFMLKLMVGSLINHKNKKFFQDDKKYWD